MEMDMTRGNPMPLILKFTIPLVIGNIFQQLYNMADTIIVGRYVGAGALAAVGSTGTIMFLITGFSQGITAGFTVLTAQRYGAKDSEGVKKSVANGILLAVLVTLFLTALGVLTMEPLLRLMNTPEDIFADAALYLAIYFVGLPFLFMYNVQASIFNSLGDSKTPLRLLIFSSLLNIVLDPVLIFLFRLGVRGAAIATVFSQEVSAAWVFFFLCSRRSGLRIRRENLRLRAKTAGKIAGLGVAPFIMQSTESLVNVVLNTGLQTFGNDLYVGSMTILQSVMQMIVMPSQGITQGVQPIMSYNYGAGNYRRVRDTFKRLLTVTMTVTITAFLIVTLFPETLARLFNNNTELVELVGRVMPIFFGGIWAFGAQLACQTTFMALGQARTSLFLALLRKVILLVPLAIILPRVTGSVMGIYAAEPIADFLASATTLTLFLSRRKKLLPAPPGEKS